MEDELSFEEVAEKYADFPRTIMRKIDTALRGIVLTERALERAKEEGAFYGASSGKTSHPRICGGISDKSGFLCGAVFRDGTWLLGLETFLQSLPSKIIRKGSPYILDVIDGELWLLDGEVPLEEVHLVPIPRYYGKKTSRGIPMSEVVTSRFPNSLAITVLHCYYDASRKDILRDEKEKIPSSSEGADEAPPCKFCFYATPYFRRKDEKSRRDLVSLREENYTRENLEDLYETINEALEEEGRWKSIYLVGGSDPRGNLPYEKEVEECLKILKTLQKCFGSAFGGEKIPVRAIASAFPKEQLLCLKEAGLTAYNAHIEVWDEKLFPWVCPGKAKYFGRQYWIDCILSAVEIFGQGNVSTQIVAGVELAQPYGFKNTEEALASNLECAEFFARYGVLTNFCILLLGEGSVFYQEKQKLPPLEYCVRLAKGFNEIRKKHKLNAGFQDYRRWSNFPDMDLTRVNYNCITNDSNDSEFGQ